MLSCTADYALRAILVLARTGSDRPLRADEIADATGAPRNYLAKTLNALAKAGLRHQRPRTAGRLLPRHSAGRAHPRRRSSTASTSHTRTGAACSAPPPATRRIPAPRTTAGPPSPPHGVPRSRPRRSPSCSLADASVSSSLPGTDHVDHAHARSQTSPAAHRADHSAHASSPSSFSPPSPGRPARRRARRRHPVRAALGRDRRTGGRGADGAPSRSARRSRALTRRRSSSTST